MLGRGFLCVNRTLTENSESGLQTDLSDTRQFESSTFEGDFNQVSSDFEVRCIMDKCQDINDIVPYESYHSPPLVSPVIRKVMINPVKSLVASSCQQIDKTDNDMRVIAPNVRKVSPGSTIEIKLQSLEDSVTVLCAVDILKMKSTFFYEYLSAQEEAHEIRNSNEAWRDPIILPEESPYEAAAFLESLHESRSIFKNEWNMSWSRLSVSWAVEDLLNEYAGQIEAHVNYLFDLIDRNHWRKNPKVLNGYRISIFRKSSSPIPTVLCGTIVDQVTNASAYSKVRVLFDTETYSSPSIGKTLSTDSMHISPTTSVVSSRKDLSLINDIAVPVSSDAREQTAVIGDVSEPFWVQRVGEKWQDPDELFLTDMKTKVSESDKQKFWEMVQVLFKQPQISSLAHSRIKTSRDLLDMLKAKEGRVLWTEDAASHLSPEVTAELLGCAYVTDIANKVV